MSQGEVLHHPCVKNGVKKGCRETVPDGDSGRQEGTVFWGQSWCLAGDPIAPVCGASSEAAIYFCMFLFYFTRPV